MMNVSCFIQLNIILGVYMFSGPYMEYTKSVFEVMKVFSICWEYYSIFWKGTMKIKYTDDMFDISSSYSEVYEHI